MGFLNPSQAIMPLIPMPPQPPSNGLCGLTIPSQEGFEIFIKVELSLFRKFHVENANGLDPLKWRGCNQFKFPNVGFLAQQVIGILRSQIKIKRIFLVAPMYSLTYDDLVLGLKRKPLWRLPCVH
jgi:hypothetical protein